jgi:hypothetical protein
MNRPKADFQFHRRNWFFGLLVLDMLPYRLFVAAPADANTRAEGMSSI